MAAAAPSSRGVSSPRFPIPVRMRDEQSVDDRPRVLVADDDADLRQYVVRVLGERYRTEAVADGAAALALALAQTPDLILTGLMLPPLDHQSPRHPTHNAVCVPSDDTTSI